MLLMDHNDPENGDAAIGAAAAAMTPLDDAVARAIADTNQRVNAIAAGTSSSSSPSSLARPAAMTDNSNITHAATPLSSKSPQRIMQQPTRPSIEITPLPPCTTTTTTTTTTFTSSYSAPAATERKSMDRDSIRHVHAASASSKGSNKRESIQSDDKTRRRFTHWQSFLHCVFWIKACFAFALSTTILFYFATLVYQMHCDAVAAATAVQSLQKTPLGRASTGTLVGGGDDSFGREEGGDAPAAGDGDFETGGNAQVPSTSSPWTAKQCSLKKKTLNSFANATHSSYGGRLEPPPGSFLWGFQIAWASDTPMALAARLGGLPPPIITSEIKSGIDEIFSLSMAQEVAITGAMLHLRVIPTIPVESITNETLNELAHLAQRINFQLNVPILLAYCPEMNDGGRAAYGMRPSQTVKSFRSLSAAIKAKTNMTAMVWVAQNGLNYPVASRRLPSARSDPTNFSLLDTNDDGVIDSMDDAFSPFYPGDDVVDWVGLKALYNPAKNLGGSKIPSDYLNSAITARGFYAKYSSSKSKPLILSSSGYGLSSPATSDAAQSAGGNRSSSSSDQVEAKLQWWRQIFANARTFMNLRAVSNLELRAVAGDGGGGAGLVDYSFSLDVAVRGVFLDFMDSIDSDSGGGAIHREANVLWAKNFTVSCSGACVTTDGQ